MYTAATHPKPTDRAIVLIPLACSVLPTVDDTTPLLDVFTGRTEVLKAVLSSTSVPALDDHSIFAQESCYTEDGRTAGYGKGPKDFLRRLGPPEHASLPRSQTGIMIQPAFLRMRPFIVVDEENHWLR